MIDVAQQVEAARGDRDAMRERREQEQRQQALAEREWQLSEPTEADRRHDPPTRRAGTRPMSIEHRQHVASA